MTIGEALKEEQKALGLTSEEMTAGIISKSTYSKVVNGKSRLSSEYLFKILIAHNIDVNEFFEKIKSTYTPKNKLQENELSAEMGIAFNNHDISKAKSCLKKIQQLSTNKYLEWRAQIAVAMLTNSVDKLSDDFKDKIINEFNNQENWIKNGEALRLFSN
ncbi:MAG: helix-turn-helix domain-containing protein, partial [Lactobacillus sp.]|nr:helix-turn-helix domain-containing protein [Lactobacillus sp.]